MKGRYVKNPPKSTVMYIILQAIVGTRFRGATSRGYIYRGNVYTNHTYTF